MSGLYAVTFGATTIPGLITVTVPVTGLTRADILAGVTGSGTNMGVHASFSLGFS